MYHFLYFLLSLGLFWPYAVSAQLVKIEYEERECKAGAPDSIPATFRLPTVIHIRLGGIDYHFEAGPRFRTYRIWRGHEELGRCHYRSTAEGKYWEMAIEKEYAVLAAQAPYFEIRLPQLNLKAQLSDAADTWWLWDEANLIAEAKVKKQQRKQSRWNARFEAFPFSRVSQLAFLFGLATAPTWDYLDHLY